MNREYSVVKVLVLAMLVAAVCNGASFYLKRTGLVNEEAYRAYWAAHCASSELVAARDWQCRAYTTPEAMAQSVISRPADALAAKELSFRYVYEVAGAERLLKLFKELFWLMAIASCVWLLSTRRSGDANLPKAWPMVALATYSAISLLASFGVNGPWTASAGLRAFLFLIVGILGMWLVPYVAWFARAVGALLAAQLLLAPLELYRGIHLFHEWSPLALASRLAGTMVQPNSLGVLAASGFAFYYSFASTRSWVVPLGLASLALIFLSGSGTGLVCAAVLLCMFLRQQIGIEWRKMATLAGVLAVVGVVLSLPMLTGRPQLFDSIGAEGGRLSVLQTALFERDWLSVAFGDGLGVNTNAALSLVGSSATDVTGAKAQVPTDSSFTGLLIQIGIVGTLLFYFCLLWAALRDPLARPFYVVLALCSLTINVTELFPVNLLLGIALAHSAWSRREAPGVATVPHG